MTKSSNFVRLHLNLQQPLIGISAIAGVLVLILMATLYPFEWLPPRTHNGASYHAGGGIEFLDMGLARTAAAPPWVAQTIRANKLAIELTVDAASDQQWGPARILTISRDIYHRNLTIGQEGRDLSIRLRAPNTDANGIPSTMIPEVFGRPGWVTIRMNIESEHMMIWIDNDLRLDQELPAAPFKMWDASYPLALGNELSGDRAWIGKIDRAVVAVDGANIDYAAPGVLEVPERYWFFQRRFNFVPLAQTTWIDCFNNLFLFIPLGFVFGLTGRRMGWTGNWKIILFASSISAVIEMLQLGIPGRYPSLNDILFNTGGSILGLVLARWLVREHKSTLFGQSTRN
jgi:VanZ family protein